METGAGEVVKGVCGWQPAGNSGKRHHTEWKVTADGRDVVVFYPKQWSGEEVHGAFVVDSVCVCFVAI